MFFQYPNAPDGAQLNPLEVVLFSPTYHDERDSNTAWTLNGKVGPLSVIYTGGLLTRNLETEADYTNYARGVYGDYYECYGPGTGGDNSLTSTCYSAAVAPVISNQEDKHWQHELRAQTPADWRLRVHSGRVFEEKQHHLRPDPGPVPDRPPVYVERRSGDPGQYGLLCGRGHLPGLRHESGPGDQQYRLRTGRHAGGETGRGIRLDELRPDFASHVHRRYQSTSSS